MTQVYIEVKGLDELVKRFGDTKLVRRELVTALDKSAKEVQYSVTQYPPPPPGSRYRRTGTLGRSITTKVDGTRLEAMIGSRLYYAPDVLDDHRQAAVHRGRWKVMSQHAASQMRKIEGHMADANRKVAQALAGEGM